jgi:hypothetical protein
VLRRVALSFVPCIAMRAGIALAVEPPQAVEWICGIESARPESIRCQLQQAVPGQFTDTSGRRADARQIHADLFRPGAAHNMARLVREAPQRYADEIWWIPLYRAPTDMALVRELAQSVMCGADSACRIVFIGSAGRVAALRDPR